MLAFQSFGSLIDYFFNQILYMTILYILTSLMAAWSQNRHKVIAQFGTGSSRADICSKSESDHS